METNMNLSSFVTHSEVTLRKLEPTVSTVKISHENSLGFKRKWVTKQSYIKYMNNIIKLKCCIYVYIYVNVLTNQGFKKLLFKETVASDLRFKFRLNITSREQIFDDMVEYRPIHLLCTCISPHMWVVLEISFQKFLGKYKWRNPFLSKTTDYWAATKTDFRNERFPGNFPNFGKQLYCETSERCCFSFSAFPTFQSTTH